MLRRHSDTACFIKMISALLSKFNKAHENCKNNYLAFVWFRFLPFYGMQQKRKRSPRHPGTIFGRLEGKDERETPSFGHRQERNHDSVQNGKLFKQIEFYC